MVQLLSRIQENVAALKFLGMSVSSWNPLLFYLKERKLGMSLQREGELTITNPSYLPTLDQDGSEYYRAVERESRHLGWIKDIHNHSVSSGLGSQSTQSFLGKSGETVPKFVIRQDHHALASTLRTARLVEHGIIPHFTLKTAATLKDSDTDVAPISEQGPESIGEESQVFTIDTLVLDTIRDMLPNTNLAVGYWKHPSNLKMADTHSGSRTTY
ncbi:hypothetical protein PR048_009084 [Dryococelus australis]|uniref:Uncharacterized protein n=1 Tax=Dryococelus australis TaxID=614101 RepID=A0ABQ9HZT9_9NEOP|nr:hypothetical protein PR048_009084 [Dryococelus australis]